MDALALQKAVRKLNRAERALETMRSSESASQTEEAWEDFLSAFGTIYSTFEEGSKGHGRSSAWFGREKSRRKKDPLLRYIHFARNAEEHGIRRIVERNSTSITLKSPFAGVRLRPDGKNTWAVVEIRGDVHFANDVVRLVEIFDERFGDSCKPPDHHLGQPLSTTTPISVAELGLAYLKSMIVDANKLLPGTEADAPKGEPSSAGPVDPSEVAP
ncbi:hypothetical protein [Methylorubrum populi]|uniref:hypothetical protein n=1 Tax=Methylorubrum populi TaxID=223967 RepID=UPI003F65D681